MKLLLIISVTSDTQQKRKVITVKNREHDHIGASPTNYQSRLSSTSKSCPPFPGIMTCINSYTHRCLHYDIMGESVLVFAVAQKCKCNIGHFSAGDRQYIRGITE